MYRFMTDGYHDIVILIHDLLHAHYKYAIMNDCIFTE